MGHIGSPDAEGLFVTVIARHEVIRRGAIFQMLLHTQVMTHQSGLGLWIILIGKTCLIGVIAAAIYEIVYLAYQSLAG